MSKHIASVKQAIAALGSGSALAKALGVHPSLPSQWLSGHRPIPADRCPAIERATNGLVRCEDLRPDVDWAYIRNSNQPHGDAPFGCGVSDPRCTSDRRHHSERREDLLPNEPTNPKAA